MASGLQPVRVSSQRTEIRVDRISLEDHGRWGSRMRPLTATNLRRMRQLWARLFVDRDSFASDNELFSHFQQGYASLVTTRLQRRLNKRISTRAARLQSAYSLAAIYAERSEFDAAWSVLGFRIVGAKNQHYGDAGSLPSSRVSALAIHIATQSGQYQAAQQLLDLPLDVDRTTESLLRCNLRTARGDSNFLGPLNEFFDREGLAKLELRSGSEERFDRLQASASLADRNSDELVTVLLPARNMVRTLETAVVSVLRQTWKNLEIIVIDDSSSDGTRETAIRIAGDDHRVRTLSSNTRIGTYGARNLGLMHARGRYVTVLDADDWMHPQRIERSVDYLQLVNAAVVRAADVRAFSDLSFTYEFDFFKSDNFVRFGSRGALYDREKLGNMEWHSKAVAGSDVELIERIRHSLGAQAVCDIETSAPLTISRRHSSSLTADSAFGNQSRFSISSPRWQYSEVWRAKHRKLRKGMGLPGVGWADREIPTPLSLSLHEPRDNWPLIAIFDPRQYPISRHGCLEANIRLVGASNTLFLPIDLRGPTSKNVLDKDVVAWLDKGVALGSRGMAFTAPNALFFPGDSLHIPESDEITLKCDHLTVCWLSSDAPPTHQQHVKDAVANSKWIHAELTSFLSPNQID